MSYTRKGEKISYDRRMANVKKDVMHYITSIFFDYDTYFFR